LFYGVNGQGDPILDTTSLGFCKIELIGYDYGQEDFQPSPTKGYGTFIAFKKTPTSGNIINVAGTQWCANTSLNGYPGGFGGPDSSKIQQIILNMFNLLLTNNNIYSFPSSNCLQQTLGVANFNNKQETIIYPNPTSDQFFVETNTTDKLTVDLYDVNGRHVFNASIRNKSNINVTTLDEGVYTLTIKMTDRIINKKLVIVR
jgi:hypothetical protein